MGKGGGEKKRSRSQGKWREGRKRDEERENTSIIQREMEKEGGREGRREEGDEDEERGETPPLGLVVSRSRPSLLRTAPSESRTWI